MILRIVGKNILWAEFRVFLDSVDDATADFKCYNIVSEEKGIKPRVYSKALSCETNFICHAVRTIEVQLQRIHFCSRIIHFICSS